MSHSDKFRNRHLSALPVLLGVAILIVSAVVLVFAIGSRDSLPPADADLAPERPDVPDDANAYIAFLAAAEAYVPPTPENIFSDYLYLSGKPVDTNALKAVVASNDVSFALLRQGTERAVFILPNIEDPYLGVPYLRSIRSMVRLLRVKGDLALGEGDYGEAAETSETLIRLGGLVQEHPESLIEHYIGRSILETGLAAAVKLAQDPDAPVGALHTLAVAMAQVPPLTNGFIRAMKAEYRLGALGLDAIAAGTAPLPFMPWIKRFAAKRPASAGHPLPRYLIQPNKSKQLYADHVRDFIENAPRCYADMALTSSPAPSRLNRALRYIRPNSFGEMTLQLMDPVLDPQLEKLCVSRSDLAAARIIVGLQLHREKRGAFPDRLDALVPDELEAVPLDPFDGKPFRYDPKRRIVYSVGKNLVDNGGSAMPLKGSPSDPEQRWRRYAEDAVYPVEAPSGK
jgi:hypothetical protein